MRTPAGTECKYYYQDFHRGREIQECRLIKQNPNSLNWHPKDCSACRVPEILHANSSPYLELTLTIHNRFLGFGRNLKLEAYCAKHKIPIENPIVGCPKCAENRPALDLFRQALEQIDDSDEK
ncbi:MAG: hypothetical protein MUE54_07515 [Anaerolineae bacterium]|jgi:hypothetical protein|nr:hypothetical protein [Anaerolineae bacterium]